LVRLDQQNFDHGMQTGFVLQGKHRLQRCAACHNPNHLAPDARASIKVKDPNRTYLGLRRECVTCHEDRHRGEVGADCTKCHTQDAWKPASGFMHSRTDFPLTGRHENVTCVKCHIRREGETAIQFKGVAHTGCNSCHTDPHRGAFQEAKFRGSCDKCHNTGGWKNNRPETNFDHKLTRFALAGKHAAAACTACHKTTDFHKPIAHERCRDCHEDPHRNQFAARDCAACHSETSFKPTRFDTAAHQRAFPLEGKHAALRCNACHQPEGRDAVYLTGKRACEQCHADRHKGEFAAAPIANRCDVCHTVNGFQPTTFNVTRHASTRLPLTGKHEALACAQCHKPDTASRYHFATLTCNGCHTDLHRTSVACETCHTTAAWKQVQPFNHSTTRFPLEGSHGTLKCAQCHVANSAPKFAGTASACSTCHQRKDPHGGQFQAADRSEDCGTCHTVAAWKMEGFNHDRARFALDIAHRNVACAKCHKGDPVRTYRGTPLECVKCH
jgi:hypothetical protein